jgi:hypothetical protein
MGSKRVNAQGVLTLVNGLLNLPIIQQEPFGRYNILVSCSGKLSFKDDPYRHRRYETWDGKSFDEGYRSGGPRGYDLFDLNMQYCSDILENWVIERKWKWKVTRRGAVFFCITAMRNVREKEQLPGLQTVIVDALASVKAETVLDNDDAKSLPFFSLNPIPDA